MRTLLILRGAPASGKDTWVKNNHLEPYMLSADQLRLSIRSPVLNKDGKLQITQAFDGEVWTQLFELLEERMQRGEFVVVNGTHYRAELIQRYKKLVDTYRYRAYIVDFTNVSKEECIRRNNERPEFQRVPNSVIEKMCAVFEAERDGVFKEVSNKYKVLDPSNALEQLSENLLYKMPSEFEKVYVFGDIHGCFEPIKEFFEKNPVNPNCEYIFTGDYIDRGIQNKEVLEFIESHLNDKNFMFLEGNHENWLRKWCSKTYTHFEPTQEEKKILKKYTPKNFLAKKFNQNIKSGEFIENTVPQIECIDKGRLRQICRRFSQFTWFNFGPNNYLVCHGGVPCVPNQFISTDEFIKGVGKYEDTEQIYSSWTANTQSNDYLVHAHRNVFKVDIVNRCVNLCDEPELGEYMRVLEINKDGSFELLKIKNNTFNPECRKIQERTNTLNVKTCDEMLENLNKSKWVQKKILSNGIVSYNFTRDAFYKAHWDEITCKARGLFVDVKSDKVVAKSYPKFFNWGERDENSSVSLKQNLKFPVHTYLKENGFLGLVAKDPFEDKLAFYSKSTNEGDFAQWVQDTFNELYKDSYDNVLKYVSDNNCTFIFECVRPVEDPHIIKYQSNKLILLDIVSNDLKPKFMPYNELVELGARLNIEVKKLLKTFEDFESLHDFKKYVSENWEFKDEGFVLEDSNGYRVKVKSRFYLWWKQFRAVKDKIVKGQNIKKVFQNEWDVRLYKYLQEHINELETKSIIDVQEEFYKEVQEV